MLSSELLKVIKETTPANASENKKLFRDLYKETDMNKKEDLRQEIFRKNLRLVLNCLHSKGDLYMTDDFFQEGCIGLWKAINGFDPTKGNSFSTYAQIAIINNTFKGQTTMSRIPYYIYRQIKAYDVYHEDGLSDEEISRKPEITSPIENIKEIWAKYFEDGLLKQDTDIENCFSLRDIHGENPEDSAIHQESMEIIECFIETLKPLEQEIVTRCYFYDNAEDFASLSDIAREHKCSRQHIHSTKNRVFEKMKNKKELRYLYEAYYK